MAPDDEGFLENWVEDQGVVPVEICPACGLIHRLTHDDLPAPQCQHNWGGSVNDDRYEAAATDRAMAEMDAVAAFDAADLEASRRERQLTEWLARQKAKTPAELAVDYADFLAEGYYYKPHQDPIPGSPGLEQDEDRPRYDERLFGWREEERFGDALDGDGFRWPRSAA